MNKRDITIVTKLHPVNVHCFNRLCKLLDKHKKSGCRRLVMEDTENNIRIYERFT